MGFHRFVSSESVYNYFQDWSLFGCPIDRWMPVAVDRHCRCPFDETEEPLSAGYSIPVYSWLVPTLSRRLKSCTDPNATDQGMRGRTGKLAPSQNLLWSLEHALKRIYKYLSYFLHKYPAAGSTLHRVIYRTLPSCNMVAGLGLSRQAGSATNRWPYGVTVCNTVSKHDNPLP
jgi:hypothetical protein